MTEERKDELLERFLAEELSEVEKTELTGAMDQDRDFAARVGFSLKMAAAMQEKRVSELAEGRKRARKKRKLAKVGLGFGLLLVLAAVVYLWNTSRSSLPFTPAEGMELMNQVVAAAETEGDVAVVAGNNWRNDLVAGTRVQGKFEEALAGLTIELERRGYCQDYQLDFYAGVLELYVRRSPDRAAPLLQCLADKSIQRYAEELKLPLVLLRLARGQDGEAAALFDASGLPYTQLPAAARERIRAVKR